MNEDKYKMFFNELYSTLGDRKILTDEQILSLYSKEASGLTGNILAVLFPENTNDVSKIASLAYKYDIPIYAQGSSSSLSGNAVPSNLGIVISFERMNHVKEISVVDGIAVVEPGVRIGELNAMLAEKGYMFPVDPASEAVATIGGAINNGSGGLRGAKYGTMKDWINRLEIVLPDQYGTIMKIGCMTVKCRTGYDLVRLIVGSEGTLALVTEAVLRIAPIPERVVTVLSFFNDLNALLRAFIEIKSSGMQPYIAEFMDDKTVDVLSRTISISFEAKGHMLLISLESTKESAERMSRWLVDLMSRYNANNIISALTQDEAEEKGIFKLRRALIPGAFQVGATKLGKKAKVQIMVGDIVVPPSKIPIAVAKIRELGDKYGLLMSLGGHIGDGNLHPTVAYDELDENMKTSVKNWYNEIMKTAISIGGSMSSEHGIGLRKKEGLIAELEHSNSLKALEIMKSIKKIFDPKGLLNPGKVFDIEI